MGLSLGAINALVNLAVWAVHAIATRLCESVYARLSAREVALRGRTSATDASEISPSTWLLHLPRGALPPIWALLLLLLLTVLLPLELLVESGIGTRRTCAPRTEQSRGVCASKFDGHSLSAARAAAVLVQNFNWAEATWHVVTQGLRKSPRASEVHAHSALTPSRTVLAADCTVVSTPCPGNSCGTLRVVRNDSAFDTVITDASIAPRAGTRLGDLTYDQAMSLAFLFWEAGATSQPGRATRQRLHVGGVEALLTEAQVTTMKNATAAPWTLTIAPGRARRYAISCLSDGVPASDLAVAVALYRGAQMEQPGVRRSDVGNDFGLIEPLSPSDAAKAVFALQAADWSTDCNGEVDVYTECGEFAARFVVPFFALAAAIALAWAVVAVAVRGAAPHVPVDARAWRRQAQNLARAGGRAAAMRASTLAADEAGKRALEATYDPRVFEAQATVTVPMPSEYASSPADGAPDFAADAVFHRIPPI